MRSNEVELSTLTAGQGRRQCRLKSDPRSTESHDEPSALGSDSRERGTINSCPIVGTNHFIDRELATFVSAEVDRGGTSGVGERYCREGHLCSLAVINESDCDRGDRASDTQWTAARVGHEANKKLAATRERQAEDQD